MHVRFRVKRLCVPFSLIVFSALAMSACNSLTVLTASSSPTPFRTLVTIATVEPTETITPTSLPTMVSPEAAEPTVMLTVTPTATATKRAVSIASRSSATPPAAAKGVFVSAIKIDPMRAKSNEPPQFTVTFLNTTGQPQMYRWFIKIYLQGQTQSFGETSKIETAITPKTSQVKAFSDWKTTVVVDCLFVIARVFWIDENNQVHEFLKSNAANPATGFYVCP